MRTRPIGQTGLEVSEIALGCSSLGNLYREISDADCQEVLNYAWSRDTRYFDTAPHYGRGRSEIRLGSFLREKPRGDYVTSTKVGNLIRITLEN